MRRKRLMRNLFVLCGYIFFGFVSLCFADDKIRVAVTIAPLKDMVKHVAKDKVSVTVMIPSRGEPHTYEPTPQQIKELENAGLYVKVGTAVEFELFWLDKLLSANPKISICDSSTGIETMDMPDAAFSVPSGGHDHEHYSDPHIWLSIPNAVTMVKNILESIISLDPANKEFYARNAEEYVLQLQTLHEELKKDFGFYLGWSFLAVHPEWGYFARDYKFEQISIEAQGKEPTAETLTRIIKNADARNIKVVLAAPQFHRKSADIIAREVGARVIVADSLAENYIDNMRSIKNKLLAAWGAP